MVYREEVKVQSNNRAVTFHDITEETKAVVERSNIKNGIVVVYSHHTTCCVITQERAFDLSMTGLETLQQDLVNALEKIMPACTTDNMYLHPGPKAIEFAKEHNENLFECHNTDAHLRSSIIGRSETLVLIDGAIDLGEFGRVHFIDFDDRRARERTIQIQVIGE